MNNILNFYMVSETSLSSNVDTNFILNYNINVFLNNIKILFLLNV